MQKWVNRLAWFLETCVIRTKQAKQIQISLSSYIDEIANYLWMFLTDVFLRRYGFKKPIP